MKSLVEKINEKGYAPSVREICKDLGIKSTSSAQGYLEKLANKGYIDGQVFEEKFCNNKKYYLVNAFNPCYYDQEYSFDEVDNMYIHTHIKSIKSTNDGGLMLVGYADDLNSDIRWLVLTKFNSYLNIEEAHAHNLHLAVAYPNPGGDVMNIRTGLRNAVLSVYDIQGRKIHEQEITDDVTSVDASNWPSGTYIWELKTENGKLKVEEGKWIK